MSLLNWARVVLGLDFVGTLGWSDIEEDAVVASWASASCNTCIIKSVSRILSLHLKQLTWVFKNSINII